VTDEESAGYDGAYYQIQSHGVRADFVICGECGRSSGAYEIANSCKGIVGLEVELRGVSSHSAYPWRADNAAVKAAHFIHALHQHYPIPSSPSEATTASITAASSIGGAHTRIPDHALLTIDFRFVKGDPNFKNKQTIAEFLKKLDPTAEIARFNFFSAPAYTDPNNPLLQSLKASAEKIEGAEFSIVRRHATSDGRFFGDVGDQSCEFGIAGEHQHADEEYITIEALENYYATMHGFLAKTIKTPEEQPRRQVPEAVPV
jgi:acetylornithine deacetylase/succinyl-diaminopimelate desuccinylase-like protein